VAVVISLQMTVVLTVYVLTTSLTIAEYGIGMVAVDPPICIVVLVHRTVTVIKARYTSVAIVLVLVFDTVVVLQFTETWATNGTYCSTTLMTSMMNMADGRSLNACFTFL